MHSLEEFVRLDQLQHKIELNEPQRQLTLLALAILAVQRPGFEDAAWNVAKLMDEDDRAQSMFQRFLELNKGK